MCDRLSFVFNNLAKYESFTFHSRLWLGFPTMACLFLDLSVVYLSAKGSECFRLLWEAFHISVLAWMYSWYIFITQMFILSYINPYWLILSQNAVVNIVLSIFLVSFLSIIPALIIDYIKKRRMSLHE